MERVKGWAPHDPARNGPALVRVMIADQVLAERLADAPRADVAKVLNSSGTHGFDFRFENKIEPADMKKVKVVSSAGKGWNLLKVLAKAAGQKKPVAKRSYQDFDGDSSSKSHEKLKALRLGDLPRADPATSPLEGKAVLDLGCNEGFFCVEAMRQGARRVVGIDFKQEFIESAQQRCPDATFIHGSWWDVPDEKFDCIFFLSAIHYEREQLRLLRKLKDHLTPNGVLVLECGAVNEPGVRAWRTVKRWDGVKKYPTIDLLKIDLLQDYAVRPVGRSIDQEGDPVRRYVFHCTPHASIAMIVGSHSKHGKTNLSFQFENKGIPTYPTDAVLKKLIIDEAQRWRPISQALISHFGTDWPIDISKMGSFIVEKNLVDELCSLIAEEAPVEIKIFCIQGEVLRHPAVQQKLKTKLSAKNIRPWLVAPL